MHLSSPSFINPRVFHCHVIVVYKTSETIYRPNVMGVKYIRGMDQLFT